MVDFVKVAGLRLRLVLGYLVWLWLVGCATSWCRLCCLLVIAGFAGLGWVVWYGALVVVWALHVATFVVAVYLLFGVVRFVM